MILACALSTMITLGIQLISNRLDNAWKLGCTNHSPNFFQSQWKHLVCHLPFVKHHQGIQSVLQRTWNKYYAHCIPNQWFRHYISFNKRGKLCSGLFRVSKVASNETKLWSPIFLIISNCHGIWILSVNNVSSWFDRFKSKGTCWT